MTTEDDTLTCIKARTKEQVRKVLDAKVETLWQLGEPLEKTRMPVNGQIPVITDIEHTVACEAVEAIAEKYGIKKHDLYMFRRAHIMAIYHGLGEGRLMRVELSPAIDGKIKWQ